MDSNFDINKAKEEMRVGASPSLFRPADVATNDEFGNRDPVKSAMHDDGSDDSDTAASDGVFPAYTTDDDDDNGDGGDTGDDDSHEYIPIDPQPEPTASATVDSEHSDNVTLDQSDTSQEERAEIGTCGKGKPEKEEEEEEEEHVHAQYSTSKSERNNPYGEEDTVYIRIPVHGLPMDGASLLDPTRSTDSIYVEGDDREMRLTEGLCTICLSDYKVSMELDNWILGALGLKLFSGMPTYLTLCLWHSFLHIRLDPTLFGHRMRNVSITFTLHALKSGSWSNEKVLFAPAAGGILLWTRLIWLKTTKKPKDTPLVKTFPAWYRQQVNTSNLLQIQNDNNDGGDTHSASVVTNPFVFLCGTPTINDDHHGISENNHTDLEESLGLASSVPDLPAVVSGEI